VGLVRSKLVQVMMRALSVRVMIREALHHP
jgi:hypothetical protein